MRTASKLNDRWCGYTDVLNATKVRSASQKRSLQMGTEFHGAAEALIKKISINDCVVGIGPEPAGWFFSLAESWIPPDGVTAEMALGLSPGGRYVEVVESEPHIYTSPHGLPLLTAGRADAVWMEDRTAVVLDWKTGRFAPSPPMDNLQLAALGLSYAHKTGAEAMRLGLYMARSGEFLWTPDLPLDGPDAARLWEGVKNSAGLSDVPRVGTWCGSCWNKKVCAPYAQTMAPSRRFLKVVQ